MAADSHTLSRTPAASLLLNSRETSSGGCGELQPSISLHSYVHTELLTISCLAKLRWFRQDKLMEDECDKYECSSELHFQHSLISSISRKFPYSSFSFVVHLFSSAFTSSILNGMNTPSFRVCLHVHAHPSAVCFIAVCVDGVLVHWTGFQPAFNLLAMLLCLWRRRLCIDSPSHPSFTPPPPQLSDQLLRPSDPLHY